MGIPGGTVVKNSPVNVGEARKYIHTFTEEAKHGRKGICYNIFYHVGHKFGES